MTVVIADKANEALRRRTESNDEIRKRQQANSTNHGAR